MHASVSDTMVIAHGRNYRRCLCQYIQLRVLRFLMITTISTFSDAEVLDQSTCLLRVMEVSLSKTVVHSMAT